MIKTDENALICDFAETYHIYDYRSLPVSLVATLAAGLRDDSRIKLKLNKQRISNTDLLLSVIADRLGLLLSVYSGDPVEEFFTRSAFEEGVLPERKSAVQKFSTIEEFEEARKRFIKTEK